MRRNLIKEISEIRARNEYNSRFEINDRLEAIENAIEEFENYNLNKSEFLKYIPISTVACFEAFFKSVYKELIDFGKPYSENVIKFNQSKNVKFDFEIVSAIQTKSLTIGEFISHILPCNNYEDINSNLSILTSLNFTEELKKFQKKSIFENVNENSKLFAENTNQIFSDVKKTFELRHIFCHEFATNFAINKQEIIRCFNNSKIFLNQTDNFIRNLLYPNSPETQTEMNIKASFEFENTEKDLEELINVIKNISEEDIFFIIDKERFDNVILEWKKYREAKAEYDSLLFAGGTIQPLIRFRSLTFTTKQKIESLSKEYESKLKKYASR